MSQRTIGGKGRGVGKRPLCATGGRSIGFTERKWTDERSNVYEQQAFLCVATAIRGIVRPQTLPGSESDVSTPLIMNADLHRIVRRRDAACALA